MNEKNLNMTGNLLASYLFIMFLGLMALIASPFLFFYALFTPNSLADLFGGTTG